jgi:8-oxo-dGTP pyrophosphatase MutT (NUDIX family)
MSKFAGAIPFRLNAASELELLLVTSRRKRRWVIPKGAVRGMVPHASAAREAFEEAGVLGVISHQQVGVYCQRKAGASGEKREIAVAAFPLFVNTQLRSWPEMAMRKRKWLSAPEAIDMVENEQLQRVLERFSHDYRIDDPLV